MTAPGAEPVEPSPDPLPEPQARRSGWYRSPGGVLAHADGPSMVRAMEDRGYTLVDDAEATAEIGGGVTLEVESEASAGAADEQAVTQAVREEAVTSDRPPRTRRAATAD